MRTAELYRAECTRLVQGKVRDTYVAGNHIIIVTTDRQSAFDRLLASVPFKGQVLNQTSAWWFHHTQSSVPNALVATPDPCIAVMRKCEVFPVEFVVRGFMTGSTETSLWTHYKAGEREYCGNAFPDGMVKNQQLAKNVLTPTTKSATRDVPVSPADILQQVCLYMAHRLHAASTSHDCCGQTSTNMPVIYRMSSLTCRVS